MMDWLADNWYWIGGLIYLITIKVRRHAETSGKNKLEQGVKDAENMVLSIANGLRKREPDPINQVQLLNDLAKDVPDNNLYKRALVDGISQLCEKDPEKKFTPVEGAHPLLGLADRAVKAESEKEKRKRKWKAAGRVGVQIVKAIL